MDINFPLILFLLVLFGAVVWLVDSLFFKAKRPEGDKDPFLVDNAKQLTPVLALVFVIRSFLYEPFQIPSASMESTLLTGDFILVNKYTYGIRLPIVRKKVMNINDPERGDVMVFFPPGDDRYFIKRVVGLPGDKISYKDKVLTINGEKMEQEFLSKSKISGPDRCGRRVTRFWQNQYWEQLGDARHLIQTEDKCGTDMDFEYTVEPGHYFMMGDNRDNSSDSREWKTVPEERIVGKAVAVWMHKQPGWNLPTFKDARAIK